tara:strand:- start:187 stop:666 length:480 start_codon:yes stop_codon:yes gene_type:complete
MADKFLNVKLSDGTVTPMKISNVSTIAFAADSGSGNTLQTNCVVTYADGGSVTIKSQARGGADAVFIPSTAGQKSEFVRALWQLCIEGVATPWNLPVIGGVDGWDYTVEPASSQASSYLKPSELTDQASTAKLVGKMAAALQGTGSSSVADISPMLSIA